MQAKRPIIATLIALLWILGGIFSILAGIISILGLSLASTIISILFIVAGSVSLYLGNGFWKGEQWAYLGTISLQIAGIIIPLVYMLSTLFKQSALESIIGIIIDFIILAYIIKDEEIKTFFRLNQSSTKEILRKTKEFLKEDTWDSLIIAFVIILLIIKFAIFPILSLITGSSLPLVVVESCSMYHQNDFNSWWGSYSGWYDYMNISKLSFEKFKFQNGLNKGDIIFVTRPVNIKQGDIIIFAPDSNSTSKYPIIHRVVSLEPLETKGDNNREQLKAANNLGKVDETNLSQSQLIGKATFRIPAVGWVKLIFFEPLKSPSQRGFCYSS